MALRLILLAVALAGALVKSTAAPASLVASSQPLAAATPGPLAAARLATIDALIALHWVKVQSWQATYAAGHRGQHFQALRSHSVLPADGQALAVDRLSTKPTDQAETLSALWSGALLPASLPFAITLNTYDGPAGRGWEAVVELVLDGQTWQRVINSGPEAYRESGWARLEPER